MSNLLTALAHATPLLLAAPISRTATLTGTAQDVVDYEGAALIVLNAAAATAGTTPTLNLKLQHSATTTSGDFADVTSGAFTQVTDVAGTAGVQALKLHVSDLKRYLRVIGTIAGSSAAFDFTVEFVGVKKAS
jgi:hypothetical protein